MDPITPGSTGAAVEDIQERLVKLGYTRATPLASQLLARSLALGLTTTFLLAKK